MVTEAQVGAGVFAVVAGVAGFAHAARIRAAAWEPPTTQVPGVAGGGGGTAPQRLFSTARLGVSHGKPRLFDAAHPGAIPRRLKSAISRVLTADRRHGGTGGWGSALS